MRPNGAPEVCPTCGETHRCGRGFAESHEAWLLWKARLSASTRNYEGQPGHSFTEEERRKIGAKSKGRRHSEATKELLRQKNLTRPPMSEEARAKISASTAALWRDPQWASRARRPRITSIEKIVYRWLNDLGVRFFREVPLVGGVIDVWCPDLMVGIEVDGDYWHPPGNERDNYKDYERALAGIQTLRLREHAIRDGSARGALITVLRSQRQLLEHLQRIRADPSRVRMLDLARRVRDGA